jgi:hypothetical protein
MEADGWRQTGGVLLNEDQTESPEGVPVAVELQVAGHLAVGNGVRCLLQPQRLEVHTQAAVGEDEVRVQGALHPARVLPAGGTYDEEEEEEEEEGLSVCLGKSWGLPSIHTS